MWLRGASIGAALILSGCSLWSGSSRPKPAELPVVGAASPIRVLWSVRAGESGVGFQPVFAAGSVWVAARDGVVTRIDASNGKTLWQTNVGKALVAGVGSDGETSVVAARDGSLIALDTAGKPKWTITISSEVVTVPAVAFGVVIVRASDNRVAAYEIETGRRIWTFQRQIPSLVLRQTGWIAMSPGTSYVGFPGGRLAALSLQNGAVRWEAAVSQPKGSNEIERISDVVGAPQVIGRDVCAVSYQGRLGCFDAPSGRATWARDVSSSRGLDMDARMVVTVDERDQIHAFSNSGASLWRNEQYRLRNLSAPLLLGPVVLVGDGQGLIHALARDDGAPAGRLATDGTAILAAPVLAGNLAIVQTSGGGIFGIGTQ
jgi:outer membrane protein assembly factor BamB